MIPGGWICRACWKANGPKDGKCYRCKAPRDAEIDVAVPATFGGSSTGRRATTQRMDTELPLLVLLVSVPLWISGALTYLGVALLVVSGVLAATSGNVVQLIAALIVALVAVPFGMLLMFISRRIRRAERWAYIVAAIVYILPTAPTLFGLIETPRPAGLPDWFEWVLLAQTIIGVIYLMLGIAAVFLLILSLMQSDREASAAPEAG